MASPAFATTDDLGDWLGESIPEADLNRAEFALRFASSLIRAETARDWLDDAGNLVVPLPDVLTEVAVMSASRAFTNPDAIEDVSGGIDDFNTRERRKVQDAGVYLTKAERRMLADLVRPKFGGIGTVSTSRGDLRPMQETFDEEGILPPWY